MHTYRLAVDVFNGGMTGAQNVHGAVVMHVRAHSAADARRSLTGPLSVWLNNGETARFNEWRVTGTRKVAAAPGGYVATTRPTVTAYDLDVE